MILSIDLGSSSLKVALYKQDGQCISFKRYTHPSKEQWVNLKVLAPLVKNHTLSAVAISGQAPTLVALNAQGKAIATLFYYQSSKVVIPGNLHSLFLPKILQFKLDNPLLFEQTAYFLTAGDYLAYQLTGKAYTSLPYQGESYRPFVWNDTQISQCALSPSLFPPYFDSLHHSRLTNGNFGLPKNVPIYSVTFDFLAALAGSGAVSPTIALDRGGQSEGINFFTAINSSTIGPLSPPLQWRKFPHCVPQANNVGLVSNNFANIFNNYRLKFGLTYNNFVAKLIAQDEKSKFTPTNSLYFLWPWANEEQSANLLTDIANLPCKQQAHILFSYYIHNLATIIKNWPLPLNEVRVTGGQGQNQQLNAYKAKICGLPFVALNQPCSELLGNVIFTQLIKGRYSTIQEACSRLISTANLTN